MSQATQVAPRAYPTTPGKITVRRDPPATRYAGRDAAGRMLAGLLLTHLREAGQAGPPLVFGIPPGGVPVAAAVCDGLAGDLDVALARTVGLPWQPSTVIAAVADTGAAVRDHSVAEVSAVSTCDLGALTRQAREDARDRLAGLRRGRPAPAVYGRVCVVVDDGLCGAVAATAVLRSVRAKEPAHLVYAAPVCRAECVTTVANEADAVIAPRTPVQSYAVGLWYADRGCPSEEDVIGILDRR